MATRVYGWEDNPAIDPFRFKLSDARAEEIVASRRGSFITLPSGRRAVQLFSQPQQESALSVLEKLLAGTFEQAWKIRPSGSKKLRIPPMPTWQLQTQRDHL